MALPPTERGGPTPKKPWKRKKKEEEEEEEGGVKVTPDQRRERLFSSLLADASERRAAYYAFPFPSGEEEEEETATGLSPLSPPHICMAKPLKAARQGGGNGAGNGGEAVWYFSLPLLTLISFSVPLSISWYHSMYATMQDMSTWTKNGTLHTTPKRYVVTGKYAIKRP